MNGIFSKKIIVAGLLALSLALIGCTTSDDSKPTITTQPTNLLVAPNGTATFAVVASGSGATYQWSKNDTALVNGTYISGATSATLVLTAVAPADSGDYSCVITNSSGSVTTTIVTLQVGTVYPAAQTLYVGAQGNLNYATAINLDAADTLFSASADANPDSIDLLFVLYQTSVTDSAFYLMSPMAAFNDGIGIAQDYPNNVADDAMVQVTSKPATQEAAEAVFNSGNQYDALPVAAGDMFVVKTKDSKFAFLQVNTVSAVSSGGSGVLSVSIGTLVSAAGAY